jgi:hypothetical protein
MTMETTNTLTWEVRYTWESVTGIVHPEHTYERRRDQSTAIDAAVAAIDRNEGNADLRLMAAHVRGPGGEWQRVQ